MSENNPPQLLMRRPSLEGLPPLHLPDGYTLQRHDRAFTDAARTGIAQVLQSAFREIEWAESRVEATFIGDNTCHTTFTINHGDEIVATATVRLDPAFPGSGYLHWVGVRLAHRGKRLGELVSLAVLNEFVQLGLNDSVLNTDDFRIPAIKTYYRLGFFPEITHPSHEERWQKIGSQIDSLTQ